MFTYCTATSTFTQLLTSDLLSSSSSGRQGGDQWIFRGKLQCTHAWAAQDVFIRFVVVAVVAIVVVIVAAAAVVGAVVVVGVYVCVCVCVCV